MAFLSDYGGGIKSVQRGVTTPPTNPTYGYALPVTVTIAAVNPAKTTLSLLTATGNTYGSTQRIKLVSATEIEVASTITNSSGTALGTACSWEVIEWN